MLFTGTTVGQVVARDGDSSVYGELTYYIVVPLSSASADSRQSSLDSSESASAHSVGSTSGSSLPFDIDYRHVDTDFI